MAIEYEGSEMNHCIVMNYTESILDNSKEVYSLRDSKNIPHVTLMLDTESKNIIEIKGNSNSIVKKEYQKYLPELLNNIEFNSIEKDEFEALSNINFNNKSCDFYYYESDVENTKKENCFDIQLQNLNNDKKIFYRKLIRNRRSLEDKNEFKFNNNYIEDLDIQLNKPVKNVYLKDFDLNLPNIKKLKINIKNVIGLKELNFKDTKLEELTLNNINIQNLILPESLKKLTLIDSNVYKNNLNEISCNEINTNLQNFELKANIINLISLNDLHEEIILKDHLKCNTLYTNFSISNIKEITDKNIIAYNDINININNNELIKNMDKLSLLYSKGCIEVKELNNQEVFDKLSKYNFNRL